MIIGNFILIKVLICQILANPISLGLIPEEQQNEFRDPNSRLKYNFRIISSLVYYTVMEFME
jgi:hypothetical protein